MARQRTKRNRNHNRSRRSRGGGYGFQFSGSSPGILTVQPYTGAGKDCATPVKMGSFGLPGFVGGSRRNKRRSRHQGGTYGFTQAAAGQLTALPFERLGCRGMRGGANPMNPAAYYASTAGYSTKAELIPGSAAGGFLRTVAYPETNFNPACMNGGSRRNRRNRNRRNRSRRND